MTDWITALLSFASLAVAAFAFKFSLRTAVVDRLPIVVFEYSQEVGWRLRNIGNGPAINIEVTVRGRNFEGVGWSEPVLIPSLPSGEAFTLTWIGHLNAWMLGAEYSDFENSHYSTISQHDQNLQRVGHVRAQFAMTNHDYLPGGNFRRHWDAPDISHEVRYE